MLKIKHKPLLLSLISAILFTISWPVYGLPIFIFIAFVPLLMVANYCKENNRRFFWYAQLITLIFNLVHAYWICYAEITAGIMAVLVNSFTMALALSFACFLYKKIHVKYAILIFPSVWVAYEYKQMYWDLSFPWFTLGNVFSQYHWAVQWYEYTGTFGGSWWVWLVNIFIYTKILNAKTKAVKNYLQLALIILLPIIFSFFIYVTYTENENKINVAIIQPNIDPYNEKFSVLGEEAQLAKILSLASTVIADSTDYFLTPETSLIRNIEEQYADSMPTYKTIRSFMQAYPNLNAIMGVSTMRWYNGATDKSNTARKAGDGNYYDVYNTAMQINSKEAIQFYHKSKLVPGVEKMPLAFIFKYVEDFALNLGGTVGSLGVDKEVSVFANTKNKNVIAPIICFESVFGGYVTNYVKKGATILAIVTNDGWWGNTEGYKHHLSYAKLRAIETRRPIVRSANTGISAAINQRGDIMQHTYWWQDDAFAITLNGNSKITLYVLLGDYLAYISIAIMLYFIVYILIKRKKN